MATEPSGRRSAQRARARSLTGGLLRSLLLAQAGIYLAAMALWMAFGASFTLQDLAALSARRLIAASVVRGAGGAAALAPTPALEAYAARRPGFAFAAFEAGAALPGSAPALAAALEALGPNLPDRGQLILRVDGAADPVRIATVPGSDGPLAIATAGDRLGPDDAGSYLTLLLPSLAPILGPVLIGAALIVPVVVRRSLRPLGEAGRAARAIDLASLNQRLPTAGAPREVAPFVEAINALLGRLEEGVARQRRFAANAAHELKTPVAVLTARIEALPPGPARTALTGDARRLALLVDQLLSAARLQERGRDTAQAVDLAACLRAVAADAAPLAIRAGRAIAFEDRAAGAQALGSRRALASAIGNLVDNALRAEPEGGTVRLTLDRDAQGSLRIAVEDHGAGVAAEDRERVFEPFWRKDERTPGAGLGLSIARDIVAMHGGGLALEDTPGGGVTFVITLPRLERVARAAE